MVFIWPDLLWAYLLVPILVAVYVRLHRKRRRTALRHADLSIVRQALGTKTSLQRHMPPVLFLISLVFLLTGGARPAAVMTLPAAHKSIILAMDVSGSMMADDVQPSRIKAAQPAAKEFINAQPPHTQIGVVAFAGTANLIQPPTSSRHELLAAVDRLDLQPATAIGSGILTSLKALFPEQRFDLETDGPRQGTRHTMLGSSLDGQGRLSTGLDPKVPPGSYTAAAIILLTDGESNVGPDPVEAAREAADRGIRIFTVGIGTAEGSVIHVREWSIHVSLDEESLRTIADLTRGDYYNARNAADLKRIYRILNSRLSVEKQETEITALFAGAAGIMGTLSCALSMLWFNRIL